MLALVAPLWTARGLEALDAHVFADNAASAAVLLKAGFHEIGQSSGFSVARGEVAANRIFRLDRAERAGEPGPDRAPGPAVRHDRPRPNSRDPR